MEKIIFLKMEVNRYILTFHFHFGSTVTLERKKNFLEKFSFLVRQPLPWILQTLPVFPFAKVKKNKFEATWIPTDSDNVLQCLTPFSFEDIHTTMKVFFFMLVGASRIATSLMPYEFSFEFNVLSLP